MHARRGGNCGNQPHAATAGTWLEDARAGGKEAAMEFPITIDSQESFDAVIKDRLERERRKVAEGFADYDALKAKAGELEGAQARIKELEDEAGRRQREDELSRLRTKVAKDAKLPEPVVASLSGTDEETLAAQAKAIAEAMRPATAPRLSEQGHAPVGEGEDRQEERAFVRKLLGRE